MPPTLIVTVDTEEEGLWTGEYPANGNTVENTRGIPRFQALCDQFGIRPTYLVDTPVVEDDRSVELLSEIQQSGRCEIGAHLHPWCTPPFSLEGLEKGVGNLLPERPEGCCAQKVPDPFFTTTPERPEGCCAQKVPDPYSKTPQDSYGWAVRIWQRLPVWLSNRLGPRIIAKVP